MLYCQSCGAEARSSFKFCPRCGGTQFGAQALSSGGGASAAAAPATATAAPYVAPQPGMSAAAPSAGLPPVQVAANAASSIDVSAMQYAGFWRRAAALVLDYIIAGLGIGLPLGFVLAATGLGDGMSEDAMNLIAIPFAWLYYAAQESGRHQATFGKRIMGLVVSDMSGQRVSFGQATGRFFGRILSGLVLCLGFLMALFTERRQTLHDKMAGAVVMYRGA